MDTPSQSQTCLQDLIPTTSGGGISQWLYVLGSVTWLFCNTSAVGDFLLVSYQYRNFLISIFKNIFFFKNAPVSKSYLHQSHLILMLRIIFSVPNMKCHNLGIKIEPSGLIEWYNCS